MPRSLFIVGMTASGKTTIGKQVAQILNMQFYDSDHVIEERTGVDIAWVFKLEGEQKFRMREAAVVDELTRLHDIVLATGGGAVLLATNRRAIADRGLVVHLCTPLDILVDRTQANDSRPLLNEDDPKKVLEQMWVEREPLYRSVADITIHTHADGLHSALASQIVDWYETQVHR